MLDQTRAYDLTFTFPIGDSVIGGSLKQHGEFAPIELALLGDYITHFGASCHLIDVGANIGAIALPLADRHPDWSVTAIEGQRAIAQVLSANAFSNFLINVEVINAVAGEASRLALFPKISLREEGNFGILGVHLNAVRPTENVRMLTLDEVSSSRTRLIKMDVEGYEAEVLKGARHTLAAIRPIIFFEASEKSRQSVAWCVEYLSSHDYELFWFYSPFITPRNAKKNATGDFDRGDFNILALPRGIPNLWDLNPVTPNALQWPQRKKEFAYLQRFV